MGLRLEKKSIDQNRIKLTNVYIDQKNILTKRKKIIEELFFKC